MAFNLQFIPAHRKNPCWFTGIRCETDISLTDMFIQLSFERVVENLHIRKRGFKVEAIKVCISYCMLHLWYVGVKRIGFTSTEECLDWNMQSLQRKQGHPLFSRSLTSLVLACDDDGSWCIRGHTNSEPNYLYALIVFKNKACSKTKTTFVKSSQWHSMQ